MSRPHSPKPAPTETTSLLPPSPDADSRRKPWFPPVPRVLFTSFLLAMTFAVTQTSLIYAFRVMTCDEYYKTHEWDGREGDRCSVPKIEADSASQIALMSVITTSCTIGNLFFTSWFMKRYGCKAAMFQQTFWAALRNLTQIYALGIGGGTGMKIIQTTQLFNIIGSAGGYQIASNMFIATLVSVEERTAMFGVLSGIIFMGSSTGYSVGGLLFNWFGLFSPFQAAFGLLCFCTIFGSLFLPYIPPEDSAHSAAPEKKSKSFLSPLKIFIPAEKEIAGKSKRDYNLLLLGCGAFFSVLATGYVHMALQLVGTDVFGFQPGESGVMLSLNLMVKAFFLSICFPRIITHGRRWLSHRPSLPPSPQAYDHPESASQAEEPDSTGFPQQDPAPAPTDIKHGSLFDLHFLRWSIFVDGVLTSATTLSTKGWHLYVAAGVLPFASGTGSACKGVTLDFVEPELRADALSAIALVEKLAQVSTISIFGSIFALLSERGNPTLVFLLNGCTAIIAFMFLLFVRMPRPGEPRLALA